MTDEESYDIQINIAKFCGNKHCLTEKEGDEVYNVIYPMLKIERKIVLNFLGVDIAICSFYHASIGRLLKDFCEGQVREFITFKNVDEDELHKIDKIIKNAVNWYAPDHEEKLLQSLEDITNDR